jgi:hypothetical protein
MHCNATPRQIDRPLARQKRARGNQKRQREHQKVFAPIPTSPIRHDEVYASPEKSFHVFERSWGARSEEIGPRKTVDRALFPTDSRFHRAYPLQPDLSFSSLMPCRRKGYSLGAVIQ